MPKLEQRWKKGLWLGMQHETNEHIVGTPNGVILCRTAKPVAKEEWSGFDAMRWTPWMMRPAIVQEEKKEEEKVEEEEKPKASARATARSEFEGGGARTAVGATLRAFHAECGKTEGCSACHAGAMGRHHNAVCLQRQERWKAAKQKKAEEERQPQEEEPVTGGSSSSRARPREEEGEEGYTRNLREWDTEQGETEQSRNVREVELK